MIQTGAAPCRARPTYYHSVFTSTRVGHQYAPLRRQIAAVTAPTKPYNPRYTERTLLYRTIAEHFETWLELTIAGQFDGQGDHHTPPVYVEKAFRKYLECGIFAHGFARVRYARLR